MSITVMCYTVSRDRTRRCSTVHLDPKKLYSSSRGGRVSHTVYSSRVRSWSVLIPAGYSPNSSLQHLSSLPLHVCLRVVCVCMCVILYICYLLIVITAMPATRHTTVVEPSTAAPYSLSGASKPQLTTLTVAALKSHLKHFKLSTNGKKSELVDRLYSHLHADSNTNPQVTEQLATRCLIPRWAC